jgi:hypothetical protein
MKSSELQMAAGSAQADHRGTKAILVEVPLWAVGDLILLGRERNTEHHPILIVSFM